ncbi:hypothetical protein THRCLA_04753 [Thraustotheca clavata]|uniref:Uncharacterized protein n=1 Tax=Thraustotheca clavata TaxID=74557 RepID=A0A1V9ZYP4_9STRA|nr:hypothetical protein THRCLA_04753 [Thraustotheca clavata]
MAHSDVNLEVVIRAPSSSVASLNKQLRELETRYHRTRLQFEKSNLKNEAMSSEVRRLRNENKALERENSKKSMLLEKLANEKKQIQAQAISNRDYAKRIEQKLAMGAKGHAAATRFADLTSRLDQMQKQHHEDLLAIETKGDQIKELESKIAILKRSVEIRIRELGLDGNIHNGMIYEIARLQEANASLALQLALEVDQSLSLKSIIDKKDAEIEHLEEERLECENLVAKKENEIAEIHSLLENTKKEVTTLSEEKHMLMGYVQEQAEKILNGETTMKKQLQLHKHTVENLELELQRRNSILADMKEKATASQQAYDKLLQAYNITQDTVVHERSSTEALRTLITDKSNEIETLDKKIQELTQDNQTRQIREEELSSKCTLYSADIAAFKAMTEELEKSNSELKFQYDTQCKATRVLQDEMERSLVDLESLTKERNEVARAMNEAVTISATAMEEQQLLRDKVDSQAAQIVQLKQAKTLMQNAMLEQLAALRKQLQLERVARLTAESKQKLGSLAETLSDPLPPPPPPPETPSSDSTRLHKPYVFVDTDSTITLQDLVK